MQHASFLCASYRQPSAQANRAWCLRFEALLQQPCLLLFVIFVLFLCCPCYSYACCLQCSVQQRAAHRHARLVLFKYECCIEHLLLSDWCMHSFCQWCMLHTGHVLSFAHVETPSMWWVDAPSAPVLKRTAKCAECARIARCFGFASALTFRRCLLRIQPAARRKAASGAFWRKQHDVLE